MNENDQLFECPNCGQVFDIGEAEPGRDWTCPACGRTFVVEETDDGPREENGERGAAATAREEKTPVIESPAASDRRNRAPSFREKSEGRLRVAGTWSVRALRHAGDAFLRLPKWARGAAAASIVLLAGIAVCSGRSSAEDVASREDRAAAPPENRAEPPKKSLSESAKRQMAIAIAAPMTSSILRDRIVTLVDAAMEAKVKNRGRAITADEKRALQEIGDIAYVSLVAQTLPHIDLSACPQDFQDEWKRATTRFSQDSEARFVPDWKTPLVAIARADFEWWRKEKEGIRRKTGSLPTWRSPDELIAEISGSIAVFVRDTAIESDARAIFAMAASPDVVEAAHKALCSVDESNAASSPTQTRTRNPGADGPATPEELCEEFASGGSHFVRKSATTVWWDVGGETPRFTCEVTFLPGGMARLTQDNTFYAYEEKNRSTNPQILARRLQQSYSQFCRDNYEIKNVKAFATSDGRLLFSGEIPVERGNVSKQIGKVFSALNEARIASRL